MATSKINHDGPTDYPTNKMPQQRLSTLPSENYYPIPLRQKYHLVQQWLALEK